MLFGLNFAILVSKNAVSFCFITFYVETSSNSGRVEVIFDHRYAFSL